MAEQNMEIDVNVNREIDLNQEFDPIAKIDSLERENDLLLKKVNELEATRIIELEAKETEIRSLKQHLEEQDKRWKARKDFFAWRSMSWRKGKTKELLTKISDLENKLKIYEDNADSPKPTDENEHPGGSSGVNAEPIKEDENTGGNAEPIEEDKHADGNAEPTEEDEYAGGSSGANMES